MGRSKPLVIVRCTQEIENMIKIKSAFDFFEIGLIRQYLTENDFELKFSLKQKLYYGVIRPLIPISVRQKLQEYYNAKVVYRQDFIDPFMVDLILSTEDGKSILRTLYPTSFTSALVLTHDVETAAGFRFIPHVLEMEQRYGFRSSWNIVPYKYKIDEGIMRLIWQSGHEIGIHGYNHDGRLYYSEKIFRERARYINEALKKYGAVGFRSPMVHRNLVWLQQLDIEYDASCFDYDPFQPFPGGTKSIWPFIAGKFVELSYTLPQDHTLFYVLKQRDISIWKNKIDWIVKNNGVVLALTHPDYLKEKNHLRFYEELLQYLKTIHNAWFCMPKELAQWWQKKHSSQV
jgi:peptidoglycan/xylan/chitin deacetylase (PgdA/CDA1 family)